MQGTFILLHVLFTFECIIFIIIAYYVIGLGLEVEASREAVVGNSPLGTRVRVIRYVRTVR